MTTIQSNCKEINLFSIYSGSGSVPALQNCKDQGQPVLMQKSPTFKVRLQNGV